MRLLVWLHMPLCPATMFSLVRLFATTTESTKLIPKLGFYLLLSKREETAPFRSALTEYSNQHRDFEIVYLNSYLAA